MFQISKNRIDITANNIEALKIVIFRHNRIVSTKQNSSIFIDLKISMKGFRNIDFSQIVEIGIKVVNDFKVIVKNRTLDFRISVINIIKVENIAVNPSKVRIFLILKVIP